MANHAEIMNWLHDNKAEIVISNGPLIRCEVSVRDGKFRVVWFNGNAIDIAFDRRYDRLEDALGALLEESAKSHPMKCFDCEGELDEDEQRRALADARWTDPLCDACNDERKRMTPA